MDGSGKYQKSACLTFEYFSVFLYCFRHQYRQLFDSLCFLAGILTLAYPASLFSLSIGYAAFLDADFVIALTFYFILKNVHLFSATTSQISNSSENDLAARNFHQTTIVPADLYSMPQTPDHPEILCRLWWILSWSMLFKLRNQRPFNASGLQHAHHPKMHHMPLVGLTHGPLHEPVSLLVAVDVSFRLSNRTGAL